MPIPGALLAAVLSPVLLVGGYKPTSGNFTFLTWGGNIPPNASPPYFTYTGDPWYVTTDSATYQYSFSHTDATGRGPGSLSLSVVIFL